MLCATTALADMLPITGSYGNRDGCAYANSGEAISSDDFFLLTPEAVTTAASQCTFGKVLKEETGAFTVAMSCEAEGDEGKADFTAEIVPGPKGYTVSFVDEPDVEWGPLAPCK